MNNLACHRHSNADNWSPWKTLGHVTASCANSILHIICKTCCSSEWLLEKQTFYLKELRCWHYAIYQQEHIWGNSVLNHGPMPQMACFNLKGLSATAKKIKRLSVFMDEHVDVMWLVQLGSQGDLPLGWWQNAHPIEINTHYKRK